MTTATSERTKSAIGTSFDQAGVTSCSECGSPWAANELARAGSLAEDMLRHRTCYHCEYWRQLVSIRHENRSVRIDGEHYLIGPEPTAAVLARPYGTKTLGFGGRRVVIGFIDTNTRVREQPVVATRNLWSQGHIPDHFRDRLPDNAIFIERP